MKIRFLCALLAACLVLAAPNCARAQSTSPEEMRAIAKEAYIYGFPLVDNYRIQYSYFVDHDSIEFKAPWNVLSNTARVYTPNDTTIQTPNSDTPYSAIGADLRAQPLVFTVPAIEKGRYYSLQFIDMYTFNFAYVGSRATGNEAGRYLLAGPNWKGEIPKGIRFVIRSETDFAFVLYRTQLFDPADIGNVKKIQAGYKVETLSQYLAERAPAAAPPVDFPMPLSPEQERTSPEFFDILNFVLQFCPANPSEQTLRDRFAKIGIGRGKAFEVGKTSPDIRKALEGGIADAWKAFGEFKTTEIDTSKFTSADGFGTRAYLNGNYMSRMAAAVLGIYGNSKEEAIYPAYFVDSNKEHLNGAHRYTLHFAPGQLPPVHAFWSVTLYELPASLLYANAINRYLINSPMLPDLKKDADGGITLYVQHESPGKNLEANWLPAPDGPFLVVMRLYWPKEEAFDGTWKAPPLHRVDTSPASQSAAADSMPVTADNFARAESDTYFSALVKEGGLGKFYHRREPASIANQTVIRLNRDTLYSSAIFDLDAGPVTITLPDSGKRFMSMQVINEDHYVPAVFYGAGTHILTKDSVGTRYVAVAIRTLVDPTNPEDVQAVHVLQDAIKVSQKTPGQFSIPNWDRVSQKKVRDALLALASSLPDTKGMFGSKMNVDPIRHLVGSASAWGGNPQTEALYLNVTPDKNDGTAVYKLDVNNVPVDGFWSVSVYNAAGYYEPNPYNAYSLNNLTAKKGDDGSVAIQFGSCDGKIPNCLPIMKGWNYMVRLYRPRKEVLDGTWTFPQAKAE